MMIRPILTPLRSGSYNIENAFDVWTSFVQNQLCKIIIIIFLNIKFNISKKIRKDSEFYKNYITK